MWSGFLIIIIIILLLQNARVEDQYRAGLWMADPEFCKQAGIESLVVLYDSAPLWTGGLRGNLSILLNGNTFDESAFWRAGSMYYVNLKVWPRVVRIKYESGQLVISKGDIIYARLDRVSF